MKYFLVVFLLMVAIFCEAQYYGGGGGEGEDFDFGSCSPDGKKYEWEGFNHYQILGLAANDTTTNGKLTRQLDARAIRKAYRQQAQTFHPDKLKPNETLTIDEINARFSAIGHAHEILNDSKTRQAYDRFLEKCEYMRLRSSSFSARGGGGGGQQHQKQQQNYNDNPYDYYHSRHQGDDYRYSQRTPSTVQKEREMLIDPYSGFPILRETTYEEFYDDNFYRITVQDFDATTYRPLYPYPQVVDEGEIYRRNQHQYHQQQQQRPREDPTADSSRDTLVEGGVLRFGEAIYSSNQQYRARVQNCQLVVEKKETDEYGATEIKIIWQSPNDVPFVGGRGREAECFLALEDGQLMTAGGSPESHNGQILWFSNPDKREEDDFSFGFAPGNHRTYKAILENDGKLVVYRIGIDPMDETSVKCIYATGLLGCFRLGSKLLWATELAKEKITGLLESLNKINADDGGEDKRKFSYFDNYDSDYQGQQLPKVLLRAALEHMRKLNTARKRIEYRLEQRSLQLVYDVESWFQQLQQAEF